MQLLRMRYRPPEKLSLTLRRLDGTCCKFYYRLEDCPAAEVFSFIEQLNNTELIILLHREYF